MSELKFNVEWQSTGSGALEFRETSAFLSVCAGHTVITRNEDLWSKTLRDSVLVSTYPLAIWLAASWWRLNHEPMPCQGPRLPTDWRMAHELGAANHGYVWPHVAFASDSEVMQVWSAAPQPAKAQSVRYLAECAVSMPLAAFQSGVDEFIGAVIRRLSAVGAGETDLAQLWALVQADRQDPAAARLRKIEAALGYDPDECPQGLLDQALDFDRVLGGDALAELAPLYGRFAPEPSLTALDDFLGQPGLLGKPRLPRLPLKSCRAAPPWERAVAAARALHGVLGLGEGKVKDQTLHDLLGLSSSTEAAVQDTGPRLQAAVGVPEGADQIKFVLRRRHPDARRFELSRFIADLVQTAGTGQWLASTDLPTSRQKYQRAFAAEFLCPIGELQSFLNGDFSEAAIEDAASQYGVSERTVSSLLANNGLIPTPFSGDSSEAGLRYRWAA